MEKNDITKVHLAIGRMLNVTENCIAGPQTLRRKGRYSDALIFIVSGTCKYTFDDGLSFTAVAGNILYLPYLSSYTMEVLSSEYGHIFCDFLFADPQPRRGDVYASPYADEAERTFRRLYRSYTSPDPAAFPDCMALLYQIYAAAIRWKNPAYLPRTAQEKIRQARNFMDVSFHDSALSVQKLADNAGMSEAYFRKLFKTLYHLSPGQYLIAIRVKRSKELLAYPYLTLEECAKQCGFSTVQYFCRVFKEHTGTTPAKYRKNC